MANYTNDSVYTHTFTPKEYQVELLDSAKKKNTIVCSSTSSSKAFILVKLIQEFSWQIRKLVGKKALLILDSQNVPIMTSHIQYLTDLNVVSLTFNTEKIEHIKEIINAHHVIVTTAEVFVEVLNSNIITNLKIFNLIVIGDCLYGPRQQLVKGIMNRYKNIPDKEKPRILGLTTGLLSTELQPERLEAELRRLEKLLNSSVDTSSEIVTLIRLSCRPSETIVACPERLHCDLYENIKNIVHQAKRFLEEHRFDLSEIYEAEFLEEIKDVANPKDIPLQLLEDFLEILEDLGPWGADRAALNILSKIEKLKVKVKYERHFILLCMTSTTFVSIRALCDHEFEKFDELERLRHFSTPKVIKFLDVLKEFKPPGEKPEPTEKQKADAESTPTKTRTKGKGDRRNYIMRAQNDDVLCALVFVHNRYKAKALFALLCVSK